MAAQALQRFLFLRRQVAKKMVMSDKSRVFVNFYAPDVVFDAQTRTAFSPATQTAFTL
jgi:hypothetical protein